MRDNCPIPLRITLFPRRFQAAFRSESPTRKRRWTAVRPPSQWPCRIEESKAPPSAEPHQPSCLFNRSLEVQRVRAGCPAHWAKLRWSSERRWRTGHKDPLWASNLFPKHRDFPRCSPRQSSTHIRSRSKC